MKAAVVQSDKKVKIEEKPVPAIKANEILLKVIAVGLNPTDWKTIERFAEPGDISGCDFVGKVVDLGADVPAGKVKKGEIRWGFLRGGISKDRGAFAEFVPVEWDLTGVVPPNITPQQAASIPIPFITAVQALFLRLKLPQPPAKGNGEWILIWSGATSVGQYAIQLAKLSGLKVATTASPARWDALKAFGADLLVDYKDPEVVKKLKEGTNDSIEYGLDCISENDTTKLAQRSFRPSGGHLVVLLPNLSDLPRPDVQTELTLAYTALGHDTYYGEAKFETSPEDRALFVDWAQRLTTLLKDKQIKPLHVDVLGNLDNLQEALDTLREGKHKTKIVLNVAPKAGGLRGLLGRLLPFLTSH